MKALFSPGDHGTASSIGLLILRAGVGGMMAAAHGWGKLTGFGELSEKFPAVLGMGSALSLGLAVASELLGGALIVLGLATRPAALGLAFTMAVAAFLIHGTDPFDKKELALLYLAGALPLAFLGAGRFSVDAAIAGRG